VSEYASSRTIVLGIETSCDETAVAVVADGTHICSNVVASQHDLHAEYGGVVPEIASRAHLERSLPAVRKALADAEVDLREIDAIAVGNRPGLIGSLLVGTSLAKALAWSLDVPVIGVDHVHAHMIAGFLGEPTPAWPAVGLVVSGGHTSLYALEGPLELTRLGRTIDDAVGEAFDKVGSILGLPHPGGPEVDRLAQTGNPDALDFPVANLGRDSLDFSFSGLKTAVLYAAKGVPRSQTPPPPLDDQRRADIAASFQRAAITAIMRNLRKAIDRYQPNTLLVGGGVSANTVLRKEIKAEAAKRALDLRLPPPELCLDNAAMIAATGALYLAADQHDDWTLTPSATSHPVETGR
jgi:N6-L-threonylcarbamoyladenine synthase